MSVKAKQPSIRFDKGGPYAFTGVSHLPKIINFEKTAISGAENEDFVILPAGTFISLAVLRCDTTVNNSGTVTLGTDGDPDALVDATDFNASAAGNWATNIGSATADAANGLYLAAADTIRLAIGGTATAGAVSGFIVYYEMDSMEDGGIHFQM